jgi:hypothetical protein
MVPIPDTSLVPIRPLRIPVPRIRSKVQVLPMLNPNPANPNPANQVAPLKVFQPYTKRKAASKCSGCGGAHTIRQCGKPPNQKKQKNG